MKTYSILNKLRIAISVTLISTSSIMAGNINYYHHVSMVTITNNGDKPFTMVSTAPYAPVPPPNMCGIDEKPGASCSYKALQSDCWIYIFATDKNDRKIWVAQLRLHPRSGNIKNFTKVKIALNDGEHVSMPTFFHACKKVSISGNTVEDCPLRIEASDNKVDFYSGNNLEETLHIQGNINIRKQPDK